jgi:tetratricopeptide (TPR) repeat protein/mono/diheme cytochrome c family protein
VKKRPGGVGSVAVAAVFFVCAVDASFGAIAAPAQPITFAREIAPILFERCGACHRPGGLAPFSVLTYASARQHATQIAMATKRRLMPPWKSEPGYGDFTGLQPLSDADIALIQGWVRDGAREGDARDLPPAPQFADGWRLGEPDLVVRSGQLYTLSADGPDRFHVWVLPIPTSVARHVRGVEFRPDNPRVVHHANILLDRTPTSRARNDQDPSLGEKGLLATTAGLPPGYFLGWAPGQLDPLLPKGLSWLLEPNTDLVVQLHLKPTGKPEPVAFSVGFFFTDDAPERTPAMLRLGRQTIDIAAGQTDYTMTDSYTLPVDVVVQALKPHAHYRAHAIQAVATLPDGAKKWLLYIKEWDFNWQHVYRYVTPVALPKGTTVTMRYTYDNSAGNPRNPQQPPQRVRWGPRSVDEMGDLWIQVLTRNDRDLAILNGDFRRKWATEDIVGDESQLNSDPANCSLLEDVGSLYLELGRPREAIARFTACRDAKPGVASTHFNLGVAFATAGQPNDAIREYEEALRIDPGLTIARNSLGNVFAAQGRTDEALKRYLEVVRLQPTHAGAQNNIAVILMGRGSVDEALPYLREALRLDARLPDAHYNLALIDQRNGELGEAVREFREAISLQPAWAAPLVDLAWLLATTSDDRLRDASQAVQLAERASTLTGRRNRRALDVLAASYAAEGRFDRALETVQSAMLVNGTEPTLEELAERRELYRLHRPYRQQLTR